MKKIKPQKEKEKEEIKKEIQNQLEIRFKLAVSRNLSIIIFKKNIYWNIVDLQFCVCFQYTAK